MSVTKTIGNVILQEEIAKDVYSLLIETDIALSAKAGQFVSVYCKAEDKILPSAVVPPDTLGEKSGCEKVFMLAPPLVP